MGSPAELMRNLNVRTIFQNLLLFLISLVFSLILAEYLLRTLLPEYDPAGRFEVDRSGKLLLGTPGFTGRQWKNTGDYDVTVHINSSGLRDNKILGNASADDFFVVGDSFAFGWGVEEHQRFSSILQKELDTPVYNLAIPGTDISDYINLIEYAGNHSAEVNKLIIAICMENDIHLYKNRVKEELKKEPTTTTVPFKYIITLDTLKLHLTRYSTIYNTLTSVVHQNRFLKSIAIKMSILTPNLSGIHINEYSPADIQSSINQLKTLTMNNTDTVKIVLIPSRALWVGDNKARENATHSEFVRLLQENEFNTIDLRPVFEASGDPLQYYFKNDGHWNPDGHQLAARAILRQIQSSNAAASH